MKKALCLLLCLAAALSCAGCAERVELCLMVISLGVDVDENGVTITLKAPNYAAEDGGGPKGYLTLTAAGADWALAEKQLQEVAPMCIRFGQLREVVISLASLDFWPLEKTLRSIDQLPNVRSHALVVAVPGRAQAFIEAQEPMLGKRLSKYLDITLTHYEQQGQIPTTSLADAVRDLCGAWRDPLLAYADLDSAYAGALAVGTRGRLLLSGDEVQLYRLMTGQGQTLLFRHENRTYGAEPRGAARLSLQKQNGRDVLVLRLPLTIAYSLYDSAPAVDVATPLEARFAAVLKKLQSVGCDPLGFGCQAVRAYTTLLQWQSGDWPARYAAADVQVEVEAVYRQQRVV